MKPLLAKQLTELLDRIDHAIDGELISVTMNHPQNFTLELSVQDKNRGYDWINIAFEFDGIFDANLLDDSKLSLIDMSDGITMLFEEGYYAFGVGRYNNITALKSSTLFLVGKSLKYEERPFNN